VHKILCSNLSEKRLCDKLSPYKFFVAVDILGNLLNPTVKYAGLCKNVARSQLA